MWWNVGQRCGPPCLQPRYARQILLRRATKPMLAKPALTRTNVEGSGSKRGSNALIVGEAKLPEKETLRSNSTTAQAAQPLRSDDRGEAQRHERESSRLRNTELITEILEHRHVGR